MRRAQKKASAKVMKAGTAAFFAPESCSTLANLRKTLETSSVQARRSHPLAGKVHMHAEPSLKQV